MKKSSSARQTRNVQRKAEGVSSWPVGPVKTVVTTDFASREPAIAEFMTKMSYDNATVLDYLAWMDANKATYEEAAVYFLLNNKDLWSGWVSEDANAKLAAFFE